IDMPVTFTTRQREPPNRSSHEMAVRGIEHYRKGDNDNAIKDVNKAIRLQPTLPILYIDRGAAYQSKGEGDKAIADFTRAIQLDPKNARAYCDRGILEDELLRQPDKALSDYNEAIRLAPAFQRAYFNRGVLHLERHDY